MAVTAGRQLEAGVGGFKGQAVSLNFTQGTCVYRGTSVWEWGAVGRL